ncbi:MAG: terminase gpA endonuclease subunit, partial [Bacilli bacterium]
MINLNKMTPAAATRLLNSTPLGTVMGERQVSRHLARAGYRISGDAEGKTVSLLKYVAWLVDERSSKAERRKAATIGRSYDEIKEAARERSAAASQTGRDIGAIPKVENKKRKEACRNDLKLFLETYFAQKFKIAWSQDHLIVIKKIEDAVLRGGLFALAMPRSTGKTTISERAAIWATVYAHRRFVALIGATEEAACQILEEIKMEIECNELLMQDFPELCYPIRKLDGIANRCKGQTCLGIRTRITWTDNEIVYPTVEGSASSGTVIQVRGITGRVRGMKAAIATGESIRPELVLIDDPQTDESAASPEQNRKRMRILSGAILGLAGPGVKISGVMPCTVIRPGDMADEILNRDRHPEWNGERRKLLVEFPKNMELWNKYHELRDDSLREYGDIDLATEFYREHRDAMDAGAVVSWPERYEPDEISGLQNAMNLFFRDKETFYSEYQNEPLPDDDGEADKITVQHVWERMNNRKRGVIPTEAEHLTMFIDVQGKLLYWVVCAFADDYTGWIVDYGAFPDQKRRYFSLKDANPTFESLYPHAGMEGKIYNALADLTDDKLSRAWQREDGAELYIEKCVIDSAWGDSTKTVYRFCKESPHARILLPSKGKGISAAQRPMTEYRKEPGVKLGFNWRVFKVRGQLSARLFEYDTNFWKSFFRQRLFTAKG